MKYVFDTSSLIILFRYFYFDSFPSLWKNFNNLIKQQNICSVKEVKREIDSFHYDDNLKIWAKNQKNFFMISDVSESQFMKQMYSDFPHFKNLVGSRERIGEKPVADPFVIAKAYALGGCVVSEEKFKSNAAKIPNACKKKRFLK